ncbi:MAG: hypothetical protein ACEQSA_04595 [Weeksellaceae bacterium]
MSHPRGGWRGSTDPTHQTRYDYHDEKDHEPVSNHKSLISFALIMALLIIGTLLMMYVIVNTPVSPDMIPSFGGWSH